MPNSNYNHQQNQLILARFLLLFLPFLALLAAAAVVHFYTETKLLQVEQETNEISQTSRARQGITSVMRSVISDLTFLAKLNELWELLESEDNERSRLMLAQEFLYFSENKGIYDNIAILHISGKELIRVNYGDGIPYIVASSKLRQQNHRDYFRETITLEPGGIYMSSFVVESSDDEHSSGPRTVLHFSTPLFDSKGAIKGILLLAIRGEKVLWGFKQAAIDIIDHVFLINEDGLSLSNPTDHLSGNTLFSFDDQFSGRYPTEWRTITGDHTGSFSTRNGLFTFVTVYPLISVLEFYSQAGAGAVSSVTEGSSDIPPRFWKIVSHIPAEKRAITYQQFFRHHVWLYSFVGLFLLLVSFGIAQISVRRYISKTQTEYDRRLRNTLDAIKCVAVTLDSTGRVIYCNDHLLSITGWKKEDVLNMDWFSSAIDAPDSEALRNRFNEVINGKTPLQNTEYNINTASGGTRLVSWNNIISFSPNGKVMTLTSIGHDITEQRRNEQQLYKLSRAVEQTQESIIITDAQGAMQYVNRGFTTLTGYTAQEALGRKCSMLKSGDTSDEEYRRLWETITSGREWRGVFHNKRKSGELYWESTMISPIRNEHNEITHFLAIKEDVTEHLRLREEVEQRNRELANAQSLAAMGQMASMVAHDLRNPLSSVKMTLQILKKRPLEYLKRNAGEFADIALDQVRYMEAILADLLLFSRPDALKPQWLQINTLLDDALSTTQKTISATQPRIKTLYDPMLPAIHGDPTKLKQTFSNLIMNALQASGSQDMSPVLEIRTFLELSADAPRICIEICDNGPGIFPELQNKVFEPFFTTKAKGTGLGLPIVKRILDQHKGAIEMVNRNKGGTKVRVTLPADAQQQLPRTAASY